MFLVRPETARRLVAACCAASSWVQWYASAFRSAGARRSSLSRVFYKHWAPTGRGYLGMARVDAGSLCPVIELLRKWMKDSQNLLPHVQVISTKDFLSHHLSFEGLRSKLSLPGSGKWSWPYSPTASPLLILFPSIPSELLRLVLREVIEIAVPQNSDASSTIGEWWNG
jgi:hypothetical protein